MVDTAFGHWLVEQAQVPDREVVKLPSETFAYLTYLGDYHPPLSGFYLLMLALLCIALVEAGTHAACCAGAARRDDSAVRDRERLDAAASGAAGGDMDRLPRDNAASARVARTGGWGCWSPRSSVIHS